jgi:RimJ/RimL family protein N-acetyltransferase
VDITGRLVRLRALRPDDTQAIVANLADPDVVRYLDSWAWGPYGVEQAQEFINRRDESSVTWAVEEREGSQCVGVTGLHDIDLRHRHCFWGICIGPPTIWGRGYGSDACRLATDFAFKHLGLEKVYLYVYEPNRRGRRAYEKAGYRLEGTFPRDHWIDGDLVTTHLMAAYRDDAGYVG